MVLGEMQLEGYEGKAILSQVSQLTWKGEVDFR